MPEPVRDIMVLFSQEVKRVMGDELRKVIVYGSYARGDYNENSDIDVMVLTSLAEEDITEVEYERKRGDLTNEE